MAGEMLGDQLLELVSSAKERVVLVAPFIKVDALQRVFDAIPMSAGPHIDCVTRWRPEDIVDGVCDLEIFDVVADRWDIEQQLGQALAQQGLTHLDPITPAGVLDLGRAPASAAGPDLRQLIVGSEGVFGVISPFSIAMVTVPMVPWPHI